MKTLFITISILFGTYFYYNQTNTNFNSEKCEVKIVDASDYIKLKGEIGIVKIRKGKMSYSVTNKNHENFDFYINANYFDKKDIPLGEVRINRQKITKKRNGGGFFTSNGTTPRIYFNDRPNNVLYSSQTHTAVIINGKFNNQLFNKGWAKKRLPRSIIGTNINGDMIIVHTRKDCRVSIHELSVIAKKEGIVNGLMFDGGASIEVGIKSGKKTYSYQIVSDINRLVNHVPTPKVFIVGNFIK